MLSPSNKTHHNKTTTCCVTAFHMLSPLAAADGTLPPTRTDQRVLRKAGRTMTGHVAKGPAMTLPYATVCVHVLVCNHI